MQVYEMQYLLSDFYAGKMAKNFREIFEYSQNESKYLSFIFGKSWEFINFFISLFDFLNYLFLKIWILMFDYCKVKFYVWFIIDTWWKLYFEKWKNKFFHAIYSQFSTK